jgi:hypothetical protein
MKAKDLDKIFDEGEVDITDYLDLSKGFKPGQELKRVNVDFPVWMIEKMDKESSRLGVPRQSLIKVWVAEKLESRNPKTKSKRSNKTPQPTQQVTRPD